MWSFVQANPVSFAVAAIILVLAVVGIVVGVVLRGRWKDNGFLVDPEIDKSVRWDRSSLPIGVWYARNLPAQWLDAWTASVAELEKAIGRKIFLSPLLTPSGALENHHIRSSVLLKGDEGVDPHHGVTDLRWDEHGSIISAIVTFPDRELPSLKVFGVALHEAGHVLGLAHDEQRESIMYPQISDRPGKLTESDSKLLRRAYG
jgi:hypothetical protein